MDTRVSACLAPVAVLLLSGFHAWLFWTHLASGRLAEPAVASRWLAGLLLAGGFLALRRAAVPLLLGRKALVLWVLVAFLHAHAALAPRGTLTSPEGVDEAVAAFVLQAGAVATWLGVGLLLVSLLCRSRTHASRSPLPLAASSLPACRVAEGRRLLLAPRPPPLS